MSFASKFWQSNSSGARGEDAPRVECRRHVLLTGTPRAGITTITHQLVAEYNQMPLEKRRLYTETIRASALASIRTLCREATCPSLASVGTTNAAASADRLSGVSGVNGVSGVVVSSLDNDAPNGVDSESESESNELDALRELILNAAHLTEALAPTISRLWSTDVAIQSVYQQRRHHLQLDASAKYLLDQIETIASPHYIPSEQDLVHVAGSLPPARAVGLCTTTIRLNGQSFDIRYELIDVSHVRGERRKWLPWFDDIQGAVIFVASLADYDRMIASDINASVASRNAMVVSLDDFDSLCNRAAFHHTQFVVILTHTDRLNEKLFTSPVEAHFPEYASRPYDFDGPVGFFRQQFLARDRRAASQPDDDLYDFVRGRPVSDTVRTRVEVVQTLERASVVRVFERLHADIFRLPTAGGLP